MKKELWQSKWTFILAAVWWAAGLGNLWRFPFQVYDNGWAAFIIAYLIILLVLGMSFAIGEVALGQQYRKSLVGSLQEVKKYLSFVWWISCFALVWILFYYVVVIGWGIDYLYYSILALFEGSFAWSGDTSWFFFNEILGITDGASTKWSLSKPALYGTIVTFICLYLFTFKWVRSVGKVVWITATLPFLTLIILSIKGLTLPWAMDGLQYLVWFDSSYFWRIDTWTAAAGQIFFSVWIALSYLVVFGSKKPKDEEIVKATVYVVLWNTIISFLSAIAVFSALWYLALENGVPVNEVAKWGPSLIFVTLPEIFTHFTSFWPLFAVIFFLTIFFLAIDSAMAILESIVSTIKEKFQHLNVEIVTLIVAMIIFAWSTLFMYGNGLYVLDIVDNYIVQYIIISIGLFEAWVFLYLSNSLCKYILKRSTCPKWLVNKTTLVLSWSIWFIFISILLFINIKGWFLSYDSYSLADLKTYGMSSFLMIIGAWIIMNIIEIYRKR